MFLLIDANSIIHQCHFVSKTYDVDGPNLYWKRLSNYINLFDPDYLAIVNDNHNHKSKNFQINKDYKANRHTDDKLYKDYPRYNEISDALGPVVSVYGEEADDTIASLIHQFVPPYDFVDLGSISDNKIETNHQLSKEGKEFIRNLKKQSSLSMFEQDVVNQAFGEKNIGDVVYISSDKDLTQLVDDDITTGYYEISGKELNWNRQSVFDKFGVYPELVPDWKALVGDPSDGYGGIKGIGGQTASKLLNSYGSVFNIYDALENETIQTSPSIKKKLTNGKDECMNCYRLAKLNQYLELPVDSINDLKV